MIMSNDGPGRVVHHGREAHPHDHNDHFTMVK